MISDLKSVCWNEGPIPSRNPLVEQLEVSKKRCLDWHGGYSDPDPGVLWLLYVAICCYMLLWPGFFSPETLLTKWILWRHGGMASPCARNSAASVTWIQGTGEVESELKQLKSKADEWKSMYEAWKLEASLIPSWISWFGMIWLDQGEAWKTLGG